MMDARVGGPPAAPAIPDSADLHAAYLDFLQDVDAAVQLGHAAGGALAPEDLDAAALASTSGSKGRAGNKRPAPKQLMDDDSDGDGGSDLDDEEGGGRGGQAKGGKKRGSDAARNKASREKLRREKINER